MSNVTGVSGWRAWFKGGGTFDSATTAWANLPRTGCLLVMVYFLPKRSTRRYMNGSDFYFRQEVGEDVIIGSTGYNSTMTAADVVARYPGAVVLEGEWTTDAEMSTVEGLAMASVAP